MQLLEMYPRSWTGGALSDTTKVGVPYRAAKHRNEIKEELGGGHVGCKFHKKGSCNQADKQVYPRLSVAVLVLDEY